MTDKLERLHFESSQQWREWLEKNHGSSPGVWLVFYKVHTGTRTISYEDSVREAVCFGWIDSLIKRIEPDCFARKFTPRLPGSKWSESNRKRWAELKADGLLSAAGQAAAPTENRFESRLSIPDLPAYIADALQEQPQAWEFFQRLAPTYRRQFVGWIHSAKQPETRAKRIRESVALLSAGLRLGLK